MALHPGGHVPKKKKKKKKKVKIKTAKTGY